MLTTLLVKFPPLSNQDPQVDQLPAVQDLPPIFGPDDPTPEFHLHKPVRDEPVKPASDKEGGSERSSDANPQLNTDGETVSGVSETTATVLAAEQDAGRTASDSFFSGTWPYFLLGLILVGWVIAQLFLKRAPSFKHHVIEKRQQSETEQQLTGHFKVSKRFQKDEGDAVKEESVTVEKTAKSSEVVAASDSSNVTPQSDTDDSQSPGQFKASTRFQNPKSDEGSDAVARAMDSIETTVHGKEASAGSKSRGQPAEQSADRPTDDEFDFDDSGSGSDSDVISEEQAAKIIEAAEIIAAVKKRKADGPGSRFK